LTRFLYANRFPRRWKTLWPLDLRQPIGHDPVNSPRTGIPVTSTIQPIRPQLAVSGAIFRDGKVLLVRRARSPGKGSYSFPGGRVEFGESLHTALRREVDEETGLRIEILGLAAWREVLPEAGGGGHYVIMSFAARWTAREPVLNDEHDDFTWKMPDQIGDLPVTDGLRAVIEAARKLV
jgi:8-oxo-dGTP diphosphatase